MANTEEIKLNVSDVVNFMRISGAFSSALKEVTRRKIAVDEAKSRGLSVSDEDLQKSADLFRQIQNLPTAEATDGWLAGRGLTLDVLENYLEENALIFELKRQLVAAYDKESYFSNLQRRNALMETAYEEFIAKAAE